MDASHVAELIVSSGKKSKLNLHIQESPLSFSINMRKTFIKDRNGNYLQPLSDFFVNVNEVDNKVNIKEEKSGVNDSLKQLEDELNETRKSLHELNLKLEKAKMKSQIHSSKQINLPRRSRNNKLKTQLLNLEMINSTQKLKLLKVI